MNTNLHPISAISSKKRLDSTFVSFQCISCLFYALYTVVYMCVFCLQPYTKAYFVDCLFTQFVINALAIIAWSWMWIMQYQLIYPDDPQFGDHFSLALGYALCVLLYVLDKPLASVSNRLSNKGFYYKLVFEDAVVFCTFFMHCILWRGAWNCTARYIIPDFEVGGWVCFVVGSIGLLALQSMSYAGAMGCAIDGESADTEVFFQSKYLRHWLRTDTHQEMRPEKVKKQLNISRPLLEATA